MISRITAACIFLTCFTTYFYGQNLVSTEPTLKTVVLENFTGINCPNCPDGHTIAENIRAANPDRVIIVGVHTGSYAVPSTGQPDFRTSFGASLANQSALTGYPAGTVNRRVFAAYAMNNGTAMSRSYWSAAANVILPQQSPVNVGVKSTFNSSTRLLTVNVEAYYTSTPPASTNYINVALLESNVIGYQSGGSSNYNHKNILRHFLTGQWGDTIKNPSYGSFRSKTYTYTVPAGYNISNCDVAVYIAQSQQEIYSGKKVAANGGSTTQLGSFDQGNYIETGTPSGTTNIPVILSSNLVGTENFNITFTTDAPNDWSASYTVNGNTYTGNGTGSFTYNTPETISINVIPGNTPKVATYTLSFTSVSQPSLPVLTKKIYVISNVTDLIVNNQGSWGDGGATTPATFQSNFAKGLIRAGETKYTIVPLSTFTRLSNANKTSNFIAIYYNVGWSFPSLTNESTAAFANYLNNGGNMLISGQDVGWDNFDLANGGNGTTTTQSFYTNYLKSSFVNDGSTANNQLTANTSDIIFDTTGNSAIVNVYGSGSSGPFMYPDQINPTSAGKSIFWYNSTSSKTSGVRSNAGAYKTVNLGFSLEMISDTNVRNRIISIAHDWFHGIITADEFDRESSLIAGYCYPNPANDVVFIPTGNANESLNLEIFDISGRVLKSTIIPSGISTYTLDVKNISNGQYYYRLMGSRFNTITRPFNVIR